LAILTRVKEKGGGQKNKKKEKKRIIFAPDGGSMRQKPRDRIGWERRTKSNRG